MMEEHGAMEGEANLPLPVLKKAHPASASSSPRPTSASLPPDSAPSPSTEISYSPIKPSPLRSTAMVPTDSIASVTFSEINHPVSSAPNSIPMSLPLPPPQHSILKSLSNPPSPVIHANIGEGETINGALSNKSSSGLLQPPSPETRSRQMANSGQRSRSRSNDRSRIVGKSNYGGRLGGPSMMKSRTSSSGGLSDSDMRPGYERKVGFDTMVDAEDTPNGYFTFCLQVKSQGYLRTKNTRTFMCAVDDNTYSERALEWLMESLVSDGDEIVAVRVLEGDPDEIDQEAARDEARELMASIVQLNDEVGGNSISIVVEFVAGQAYGKITNTVIGYVHMYRPDSLTVGTRGKSVSALQKIIGGASMGSSSRDILNRSPVPVVIVRPEAKVKKHLAKRQNDPKRRSYHDLVALQKNDELPISTGRRSSKSLSHSLHFGSQQQETR